MPETEKSYLRLFIVCTYITFWLLLAVTGVLIYLKTPVIIQTIMKAVCAWASTFVLLLFFKKFCPEYTVSAFIKKQFTKVRISDFLIPAAVQVFIAICAYACLLVIKSGSVADLKFVSPSSFLPLVIVNITSGPMGEELGWRSYALNELEKKHTPLAAAIIVGLAWGFWHFPVWLLSGYTGIGLLIYCASFMLSIVSFSVFLALFYFLASLIIVLTKKNQLLAV
jgi:membrane protease YdiL (CAAX protease family)